jgi:hypothetical protein
MVFQCARGCEHFGVSCLGDLFGFLAVPVQEVKLAAGSKGTEFLLNICHPLIVSFSSKAFRRVRLRVEQVFDSNPRCARVVWPNFDHAIRSRLFGLLQPVLILFQLEEILLEPEKFTTVAGVLFRTLHVYPKGNAGLPGLTVATTGHGARERLNIISDPRQNAAQSRSYRPLVNQDR